MDDLTNVIKKFLKDLFANYSRPQEIKTVRDYRHVKKWVKKVSILYIVFTILALFGILLVYRLFSLFDTPQTLSYIIVPPCLLLTNWGYATLITYLPEVVRSIFKAGKTGFEVGEKIETTHIQVTHEYGNNYRVSSTTDNKGCLFGFFGGIIQFIIWAIFCVYIGPFLTFKKIKKSREKLKQYKF